MSKLNCFDFDSNYIIIKRNVINNDEFSVTIRTKIESKSNDYGNACDEWINMFSITTKSNWIVKNTFPNKINYLYRKGYVCQHSSKNKIKNTLEEKNRVRNKNCKAFIKIIIKKDTMHTRRRDQYLREGLNSEVQVCP